MPTNNDTILPSIEIESALPVKKSIIWLHGLGADSNDFVPVVSELNLSKECGIRFIFPDAPMMPITINNGYIMRAWYDILSFTMDTHVDKTGITKSIQLVRRLIQQEEKRGINSDDIILAGFSQGAAMALTTGLQYPKRLGGIIALSGYLPLFNATFDEASEANRDIPIFIAHGTEDPIVPYALGKTCYMSLQQTGYKVEWHSYPIAHTVCAEEVVDLRKWIERLFH